MVFHQGSLEGCSPPPPTAQLPLTQGRFSSRAHFPKCTCFESKMSDISETNNPRFCSFIFTKSHLEDCVSGCSEKILNAVVLIDIVDVNALVSWQQKLFKCHRVAKLYIFFKEYKVGTVEKGNYVQQHPDSGLKLGASIKGHLIKRKNII